MMKYLALITFLAIAACQNTTPQDQAAYLEQALTAGETGWVGFLTFCNGGGAATVKACNDRELIQKGADQRQKAFDAVEAYRNAVQGAAPQTTIDQLLTAANAATAAFQAYEAPLPKGN